ncbi:MAG TPA: hypothetical protein VKB71_11025 [Rhizomicrobium sp.]|nr:hypothetical protein [Rhizomicrobium sp.]
MSKAPQPTDRQRRLADALRENLRRRKAHGRDAPREIPEAGHADEECEARPNPAQKPV